MYRLKFSVLAIALVVGCFLVSIYRAKHKGCVPFALSGLPGKTVERVIHWSVEVGAISDPDIESFGHGSTRYSGSGYSVIIVHDDSKWIELGK